MTRPRLPVLLYVLIAAVMTVATLAAQPTSSAGSAPPECRWAARGLLENRWLGGAGSWSDATKWSRGEVPGVAARDYACIPKGSDVVVDVMTPRVDLDVLELGLGSRLTLRPGTALFVWGDQDDVRSITKRGSVIEVNGATLGGGGRLHVIGTLTVHRSTSGEPATLTTRPDSSSYSGPAGILEIGDEGTLDVRGSGHVRIAREYIVDVHGRARLRDDAGLAADHGTTFMLQKHYYGKGVGRLVILNDQGFVEGDAAGSMQLAWFVNRGRIVKRESTGTSRIEASYVDAGEVREKSGYVELPAPVVMSPPETDTCGEVSPCDPLQTAAVRLPDTDPNGAEVVIEPLEDEPEPGAIGVPMKVHAMGLQATIADPAVIKLRYDLALFQEAGIPPNATELLVGHADGPDETYVDIPRCAGRGLPLGATACLDIGASTKDDGDLVLVIRTLETSRWIAH